MVMGGNGSGNIMMAGPCKNAKDLRKKKEENFPDSPIL